VNKLLFVAAFAALLVAGVTDARAQKSEWAPIKITYSVPPGLKPGDEVTTEVAIAVRAKLDRLSAEISAIEGVTIVASPEQLVFDNVEPGSQVTLRVKVRLTSTPATLGLVCTTTMGDTKDGVARAIVYGVER
jgi:hypothetical protein